MSDENKAVATKEKAAEEEVKKEYVEVEYLKDVLPHKKGDTRILHSTTANALVKHKHVKITKEGLTIKGYDGLKTKKK